MIVTVFAALVVPSCWLPNAIVLPLAGDSWTLTMGTMTLPTRLIEPDTAGEATLTLIVDNFGVEDDVGVNVTVIVQVPFGASVAGEIGQLVLRENCEPAALMLVILRLALPVFCTVAL